MIEARWYELLLLFIVDSFMLIPFFIDIGHYEKLHNIMSLIYSTMCITFLIVLRVKQPS